MNNLALLYVRSFQHSKALPLYKDALHLAIGLFGENDLTVATINSNLSMIFSNQALYEKSLIFARKAYDTQQSILGDEHPDTLITLNNIGLAFWGAGNLDEARRSISKAYKKLAQKLAIMILDRHALFQIIK